MKYTVKNNNIEEIITINVHEFTMGDADDPDLYAAVTMYNWQESEQGQWIMLNAIEEPTWHRMIDYNAFGFRYCITARLAGSKISEYFLRFGK